LRVTLVADEGWIVFADPGVIETLAARSTNSAETLRDKRTVMVAKATHTVWESDAASRFLLNAEHAARELMRDAQHLDDVAKVLRRHAGHVRDHLADLAEVERRAKKIVGAAAHDVEETGKWIGEHVPW
jgi:hypothetical protein